MSNQKTALVTGANKGIGYEVALQLAQQGYLVWLGCRDEARGIEAAKRIGGDVRFVRLDVTDAASVKDAAARIEQESGKLDVLVNNAAVLLDDDGLPSKVSFDVVERTFDVNVYGALRVVQAFVPLVQKAEAGRVVNVSSTMGSVTSLLDPNSILAPLLPAYPNFVYAASKTSLNALTAWLAFELRDTQIKVTSVCPGYNSTDMNHNADGAQHPSEGAKVVVRAATLGADAPSGTFIDANGTVGW